MPFPQPIIVKCRLSTNYLYIAVHVCMAHRRRRATTLTMPTLFYLLATVRFTFNTNEDTCNWTSTFNTTVSIQYRPTDKDFSLNDTSRCISLN